MPPSGFSQKAINGLLEFVKSCYQTTLRKYKGQNLSELKVLEDSISFFESVVQESVKKSLPIRIPAQGIQGLMTFISENYKDLVKDIEKSEKPEGYAMQAELEHISTYLSRF